MDIDWSKAPVDAEFGACGGARGWSDAWYKKVGDQWFCQLMNRNDKWETNNGPCGREDLEGRPAQPWNVEGLPPVGLEVEAYFHADTNPDWLPFTLKYFSEEHVVFRGPIGECHMSRYAFDKYGFKFRQIRTPEQVAAEECDKAVKAMLAEFEHTGSLTSHYEVCEVLHKAGYRKQVSP